MSRRWSSPPALRVRAWLRHPGAPRDPAAAFPPAAPAPLRRRSTCASSRRPGRSARRGRGIAAADHRGRVGARHRLSDRSRAGRERLELEGAHGAVPEHRPGGARSRPRRPSPCAGRCRGPSSRPARRRRRSRAAAAPPSKRSAITRSRGSSSRQLDCSARSRARRASSTPFSSTSESPVGLPCARKKLKHMAPPIRIASASSRKRSMTPILPLTFAPPSTTTKGRSGRTRRLRKVTSRSSRKPRDGRQRLRDADGRGVGAVDGAEGIVDVELREPCERTESSGSFWSHRARSGSSRAQDLARPELARPAASTSGPTTAGAWRTGAPGQLAEPARHGAIDSSGSRSFGRPRCDTSTSRGAALAQMLDRRQGRPDARCRRRPTPSRFSSGTLKSTRTSTRSPSTVDVPDGLLRKHGAWLLTSPRDVAKVRPSTFAASSTSAARVAPLVVVPGEHLHEASPP